MKEREFNLLDEPWIKVLRPDLQMDTLSLQDVMLHGQDYKDLGGENALQNFAVLRLLIAVAYTIFSRVDENGKKDDLATIDDLEDAKDAAIGRWSALWNNKQFPENRCWTILRNIMMNSGYLTLYGLLDRYQKQNGERNTKQQSLLGIFQKAIIKSEFLLIVVD